jgi:hypothetical protein
MFLCCLFVRMGVVFRSVRCGWFLRPYGSVGFVNPWGFGYWLTCWTHPSIWVHTSALSYRLCLVPVLFGSLMFQVCWDLQVSRRQVCLHFGDSCARKSFILAALFRVLLALGSGSVLAVVPFASLNPNCSTWIITLLSFFVTWLGLFYFITMYFLYPGQV